MRRITCVRLVFYLISINTIIYQYSRVKFIPWRLGAVSLRWIVFESMSFTIVSASLKIGAVMSLSSVKWLWICILKNDIKRFGSIIRWGTFTLYVCNISRFQLCINCCRHHSIYLHMLFTTETGYTFFGKPVKLICHLLTMERVMHSVFIHVFL